MVFLFLIVAGVPVLAENISQKENYAHQLFPSFPQIIYAFNCQWFLLKRAIQQKPCIRYSRRFIANSINSLSQFRGKFRFSL